jgi:hypothetical protein
MLLLLAAAGMSLACLEDAGRHAFFLDPEGAATWSVTEEEIRDRARLDEQQVAVALRSLGASWVETRVVRDRMPYSVVTEARFESASRMLETFLKRVGFEARADLWFDGDRTRLSFAFRDPGESDSGSDDAGDPAMRLLAPVEAYRFVLTRGEFISAVGFRLDADRNTAWMIDPDDVETRGADGEARYSLTWTDR